MEQLRTDYLVVGTGAMGMGFTDVLLSESDATITIVDRRDRPGGHWNDAYPFVRLHQPSSFYGVDSTELSSDRIDPGGWNEGLAELASGVEVLGYFERVMLERFLPSGRVRHLPMHEYADGVATSLVTGETTEVQVGARTVDCTYMNVQVPRTTAPSWEVDPGATCIPPNLLPRSAGSERYVLVGAGKTAVDAALWLLDHGVGADAITWVRPRDAWMLDRENIQPGTDAARRSYARQFEVSATATSINELFERLESGGDVLRLDPDVTPTMYRCATVTRKEADALAGIRDVVRAGHVTAVGADSIVLEFAEIPNGGATVVDCSADGLARRPAVDIFGEGRITAQAVRTCQQVFSAGFLARVESAYDDDATKNTLCRPVPHPDTDTDWLRTTLVQLRNQVAWAGEAALSDWLADSRLDPFSALADGAAAGVDEMLGNVLGALENLPRLLASVDGSV